MKATFEGQVLADSNQTLEVDGYVYFPRDAVKMTLLEASPKNADDKVCPHGVQFYDVITNGKRAARAAWSYEKPTKPHIQKVDHYVAFWRDVKLS